MAMDPEKPASPPCAAADMDDLYMGFALPAEILQAARRLAAAARTSPDRAAVRRVLAPLAELASLLGGVWPPDLAAGLPARPENRVPPWPRLSFAADPRGRLSREMRALLPRLRDDRCHRLFREAVTAFDALGPERPDR